MKVNGRKQSKKVISSSCSIILESYQKFVIPERYFGFKFKDIEIANKFNGFMLLLIWFLK